MRHLPHNIAVLQFLLFTTLHETKFFVNSCKPMPPCGTEVIDVKLTDIPGTLHVQVNKYQECGDNFQYQQNGDVLSSTMVELDMETGEMRTEIDDAPFMAQQTDLNLFLVPTVNQDYRLSFTLGSDNVSVLREGCDDLTFTLPGFDFKGDTSSPYEGLVGFYSKVMDLFYFIYGDYDNENLAVCKMDETCNISELSSHYLPARNSDEMAVYDSLRLVGLEVPCCVCIDTIYFAFDEFGLTEFDTLEGLSPFVVDPRIGVAYSARKNYDENSIQIISGTLPHFSKTGPEQHSYILEKAKLEEALNYQV